MNEAQTMATLTGLIREIHQTAVEHGWWECETCEGSGERIVHVGHIGPDGGGGNSVICLTCDGSGEHRNPAELLALVHSEVSEALEALRRPELDEICDKCVTPQDAHEVAVGTHPGCVKCGHSGKALGGSRFAEELADVLIRVLDMCGGLEVDVASAVIAKLKYNEGRPRKHGKQF